MTSILGRLRSTPDTDVARSWDQLFSFNGNAHFSTGGVTAPDTGREAARDRFVSHATRAHDTWDLIGSAVQARQSLMSQLRFQWEGIADDNRGRRFGSRALTVVEDAPGGVPLSTLMVRVEQDVSYSGNAYLWVDGDGNLRRLRPDLVDVILSGEPGDPEQEAAGYAFHLGPRGSNRGARLLAARSVIHFAPDPDPLSTVVGRSWVTGLVRDLVTDTAAADHVNRFFTNSASPAMIVSAPPGVTPEQFRQFVVDTRGATEGVGSAGKTLFVAAGTDAKPIGSMLSDLDLSSVKGGVENRVAVRSRVPAVVLGVRESMQGSALNAGNYAQTRRLWADSWFTPHAQQLCDAMHQLFARTGDVPGMARLTFDRDAILFLQEDRKDAADIAMAQASAIETLHRAGFTPDAIVDAVRSGDLRPLIGAHSGRSSVQLVPTDADTEEAADV